ncbi:MAG: glycosyltransferase family 39 protein [Anaerolineae bacterium]|nr:glycosyltransferase family 39 protein [Anaerolineae bacterium]
MQKTRFIRYSLMIIVLLIAATLRWVDIGDRPLSTDESTQCLMALDIGQKGEFSIEGPPMSIGRQHSPYTVYLNAIPFALYPDPRLARMFIGVLHLFAVALIYKIGERYFGWQAGVIAALLFAVHPGVLDGARKVWNPNLGAPFAMAYIFTGLLGYYDEKRWARLIHPPLLVITMASHPNSLLLAPISVFLWVQALVKEPKKWRTLLIDAFFSCNIAIILLLPWLINIGLFQPGGESFRMLPNRGLGYLLETWGHQLGTWRSGWFQPIFPALTAVGAIWLIIRGIGRRRGLPGLIVVMGFTMIPLMSLILDTQYRDYHLWPHMGNAFLIVGAVLGGITVKGADRDKKTLFDWRGVAEYPAAQWIGAGLAVIFAAIYIGRFPSRNDMFDFDYPTLDEQIAAVETAAEIAKENNQELLILTGADSDFRQWGVIEQWATFGRGIDLRVIWSGKGLPLPENGAMLLAHADYDDRPLVFNDGEMIGEYLRMVEMAPADKFVPTLQAITPIQFSNGATLLGFFPAEAGSLPAAGETWVVYSLWRLDQEPAERLTSYVHLADGNGTEYAMQDLEMLPGGTWRSGELFMQRWDLEVLSGLPDDGQLFLKTGMYSALIGEDIQPISAEEEPVGTYAAIQIRGSGASPVQLTDSIALDSMQIAESQEQGPPVQISTTLLTTGTIEDDLRARWRVLSAGGETVYESIDELSPPTPTAAWAVNAFSSRTYSLRIPPDIEPGLYDVELQLVDDQGEAAGEAYRQAIEISERERTFDAPAMANEVEVSFAEVIRLAGYDIGLTDRQLDVALYWQAEQVSNIDYTYFIHVMAGDNIVAQVDSGPLGYTYPTSWWAPGEFISNPVTLDLSVLPPGTYSVWTGFYDPATFERLTVDETGEDRVLLGEIVIE